MRLSSLALALAVLISAPLAHAQIESFSPTGSVKQVRQVTARFMTDMVPLGTLAQPDPFTVSCPAKGQGRWIDTRNWSYDFEHDLPAGLKCSFSVRAGQRDLAGRELLAASYTFDTGGPAVLRSIPHEGSQVAEDQVFVLGLDAPVRKESVLAQAWCKAEGINERIRVRVLEGAERRKVLHHFKDFVDSHVKRIRMPEAGTSTQDEHSVLAVQCRRTLPAAVPVSLVWEAGIMSTTGIPTAEARELAYRTRPDFTARFECRRMKADGDCIPFLPMSLYFNAALPRSHVDGIRLAGADGKTWTVQLSPEDKKAETVHSVTFKGPFPPDSAFKLSLPANLADDAGRPLVNAASFPLQVRTGQYPPLAKFPARFGILEARGDRLLPLTVRAIEKDVAVRIAPGGMDGKVLRVDDADVLKWLRVLGEGRWEPYEMYRDALKKPLLADEPGVSPIKVPYREGSSSEVIGIPLQRPGFYVVELASPLLGSALIAEGETAYVNAAALVTNMVAHFKHGRENSVVWVTSLDKGRPVAGAKVSVRGCRGQPLWSGATDAQGIARIGVELASGCPDDPRYFVSARLGDDMTFTLSSWNRGIEAYRFGVNTGELDSDDTIAATVFDRTLLRAGETVHMKHFLRRHTSRGIDMVAADGTRRANRYAWRAEHLKVSDASARPATAYVIHEGTDEKFELPLTWQANGTSESVWKIPGSAKLGSYDVYVGGLQSGSFRVEQFRVPLMKAVLQAPREPLIAPAAVPLDVQLNYLSGGGAAFANVTLRSTVTPRGVAFDGYEAFRFAAPEIREEERKSSAGSGEEDEWTTEQDSGQETTPQVRTQAQQLDKAGGARVLIGQLAAVEAPRDLLVEMSYQDPNGETQTVSQRVALWASALVVGLRQEDWIANKDDLKFQAVVLDFDGKPVAGVPVSVELLSRTITTHRKRLLGGLYAYESSTSIRKLGTACDGSTDQHGLLSCTVRAPAEGNLIVQARVADSAGRTSVTHNDIWVRGDGDHWFDVSDSDRIDLLPAKKRYEPGQNATFQVRSPFRDATALVTVEREGVIDTFVRRLRGKDPTFSIPIKASYAPNVYVSALVVRGRVGGVKPTALLDLGKPAYKLGIAPVRVGWAGHELKVQVAADREVYKVREKATVKVKVARANGKPLPAGSEIALAAVDTGLLELMPNASWNLLETMMQERSLQVETATAQMQVVGKRHFGRKALPAGGGGGRGMGRELFDTLLFWKARVTLDANGEATVQVPLNDSLTSFRIVAIASGGASLFGTGSTEVRSSQDLMLMSGLPQLVREGDRLRAGFTVRNASDREIAAQVSLSVTPEGRAATSLPAQQVTLAAGQAREVGWDYVVPAGARKLAWQAEATSPAARDLLRVQQQVAAAVPVRTLQATLLRLDRAQAIPVQAPPSAQPGRGGITVQFTPRLAAAMPGVREYMGAYAYTCFEQRTSRAVALRDKALWETVVASLPAHLDGDGLVKYFPLMSHGSDTLTAYVLSVATEAGYPIPADQRERMEQALAGFVRGQITRGSALRTADLAVRKVGALEALSRTGPVEEDMLGSFDVAPTLWPTAAVIDWYLVLQRSPQLPQRAEQLKLAEQVLRARLNLQGTTMGFSTEATDGWWWLMMSADANANRLLLAMMDNPAWREDMGRLARGALGRQVKGRWSTTVANAWGVLAMEKFSAAFEKVPVAGASAARLGAGLQTVAWPASAPRDTVSFAWPGTAVQQLGLAHKGAGIPWAVVQTSAAIPLTAPLSSGYRIRRTVMPLERKAEGTWSRGDVYRVRLDLEAQADMTWVVVDDPVPAGATVLGSGLGRDSQIQSSGEKQEGWVWPAFKERANDGFRSYYEFVPKGAWSIEYTVRLNNAGHFTLPPTRVEAMYKPEMFGESPNAAMTVAQ